MLLPRAFRTTLRCGLPPSSFPQRLREVDPLAVPGRTGVFFSGGSLPHLPGDLDRMRVEGPAEYFGLEIGQDKDYLASTVASRKTPLAY